MKKCYGGIDLGGSFIKAGLIDIRGKQFAKFKIPTNVESGIPAVKSNLLQAAKMLVVSAADMKFALSGIGIGSPGTIKFPQGIVTGATPNIPGWIGTNISSIFSKFKIPVAADNDANCMGLAEAHYGAGKGTESGFYLTLGTGIGGAIVIDGKLLRGASYAAGEFGHMVFKFNGKLCKAGHRGCLESYAAAPALIHETQKYIDKSKSSKLKNLGPKLTPEDIFRAFRAGDRAAVKSVNENAEMIGVAIGSIVNLLNPQIVVIGGGLSHGGGKYIDLIKKHTLAFAFTSTTSILKIKKARFGNDAGWIGAACLVIPD